MLGVLLLDGDARARDARAAQLDVGCTRGGDACRGRSDVVLGEHRRTHRERQVLLVRGDVDQPPRDFGKHVELGRCALGVDDRCRRVSGARAQLALVAELDDLRQRKRRLRRVETAGSAGAEHVLSLRFQHERRA